MSGTCSTLLTVSSFPDVIFKISRSKRISHEKLFTICSLIVSSEHLLVHANVSSCPNVNPPFFGISLKHHSREIDVIYPVRDVFNFCHIGLISSLFTCTSAILFRASTIRGMMSSLATVIIFSFEFLIAIVVALFRTISSKLPLFVM